MCAGVFVLMTTLCMCDDWIQYLSFHVRARVRARARARVHGRQRGLSVRVTVSVSLSEIVYVCIRRVFFFASLVPPPETIEQTAQTQFFRPFATFWRLVLDCIGKRGNFLAEILLDSS